MIFRAISAAVGLLLLAAAVVQLNDPDPFRWTLLYGIGAVVGGVGAVGRLWWKHAAAYALLGVGVGIVHLVVARDLIGADGLQHELVREGLGALIAGILVGGLAWWRHRVDPDQPRPFSELPRSVD